MALEEDEELSLSCGVNGGLAGGESGSGVKAPRLPRWTRHEILVLIQGKRVAENRVRRGGRLAAQEDSGQPEPKWASVSSYCRRHGVNRGPVQCRKRWSNLAGDFKKIKEWESGLKEDSDSDSFWVMRNDLRREKKLPGFFDKEVYDILDGTATPPPPPPEALFDSGRSAAPEEGLFPEDPISTPISAPLPISEKQYQPVLSLTEGVAADRAITDEKQEDELGSTSRQQQKQQQQQQQGKKRKHCATQEQELEQEEEQETETETERERGSVDDELVKVLERNGSMIGAHLEAQNTNWKLDREERKDHSTSLIAVLSKLADALGRIADKL